MVCRSMLASDSGEMDSALFLLSRGVSRGLEKRDTEQKKEDTATAAASSHRAVSKEISCLKNECVYLTCNFKNIYDTLLSCIIITRLENYISSQYFH